MSERERQIAQALKRDEFLRSLDSKSIDELRDEYKQAWEKVFAAKREVEPVLNAMIARVVRQYEPDATTIRIDENDTNHGWSYAGDNDDLRDDDELSSLLDDLGEFMPSDDHPAQDYDFARELP